MNGHIGDPRQHDGRADHRLALYRTPTETWCAWRGLASCPAKCRLVWPFAALNPVVGVCGVAWMTWMPAFSRT